MKDVSGKELRLGNTVKICTGDTGVVVFSIDTNEYSLEFTKKDWEYLQAGIMIRTLKGTLIHFTDSGELEIVADNSNKT